VYFDTISRLAANPAERKRQKMALPRDFAAERSLRTSRTQKARCAARQGLSNGASLVTTNTKLRRPQGPVASGFSIETGHVT
jgi:hypothetical protein